MCLSTFMLFYIWQMTYADMGHLIPSQFSVLKISFKKLKISYVNPNKCYPSYRYAEIHNWKDVGKKYVKKNELAVLKESLHEDGPLLPDCSSPQYSKILGFGFTLIAGDRRDNCFLTYDGDIVILKNVVFNRRNHSLIIIGQCFTVVEDFYTLPCKSQLVEIYVASKLSGLKQWPFNGSIKKKV